MFVIDHEGIIRYYFDGAGPEVERRIDKAIRRLLDKVPSEKASGGA